MEAAREEKTPCGPRAAPTKALSGRPAARIGSIALAGCRSSSRAKQSAQRTFLGLSRRYPVTSLSRVELLHWSAPR